MRGEHDITLGEICNTLRVVWGVCGGGVLGFIGYNLLNEKPCH